MKTTSNSINKNKYLDLPWAFPTERLNAMRIYRGLLTNKSQGYLPHSPTARPCPLTSLPCFSTSGFETSKTKERQISYDRIGIDLGLK